MREYWESGQGRVRIKVPGWPPYSPDLNPIENTWSAVKRGIYKTPLESIEQLEKAMVSEWVRATSPNQCREYIKAVKDRARQVVKVDGNSLLC